jgi:hypothetical protein
MTNDAFQPFLLSDPRPWAFSRSELTAGLRRITGDPKLTLDTIQDYDIPKKRPSIGRIRGLQVTCKGEKEEHTFNLVLKEPIGTTRTGTAGVGLREVSVYRVLADQLPVRIPELLAAHPLGEWLVLKLLPPGRDPEHWTAAEYYSAIDHLIALHDRFWDLGADLTIYNWLSRPLDSDFAIYVKAAAAGVGHLVDDSPPALFSKDPKLAQLLSRLVLHADKIATRLQDAPATMIHGDYWPGNIHMEKNGTLTVFDWQQAGIGPGILDLINFIQASRWWFDPLPIQAEDIVAHYRQGLAEAIGYTWNEADWQTLWAYGLLWTFLANWIDLIVAIPDSLVETRFAHFEDVWLKPLRTAAAQVDLPKE